MASILTEDVCRNGDIYKKWSLDADYIGFNFSTLFLRLEGDSLLKLLVGENEMYAQINLKNIKLGQELPYESHISDLIYPYRISLDEVLPMKATILVSENGTINCNKAWGIKFYVDFEKGVYWIAEMTSYSPDPLDLDKMFKEVELSQKDENTN